MLACEIYSTAVPASARPPSPTSRATSCVSTNTLAVLTLVLSCTTRWPYSSLLDMAVSTASPPHTNYQMSGEPT